LKYTRIIKMAKDIQNNNISPIQGIRNLRQLTNEYHLEDEISETLRALDSETDHLPNYDSSINLSIKYIERIKKEEKLYLDDIYKLCNDILEKYQI